MATAHRFCAEGAHVIMCDVQEELGRRAAAEIREKGGNAQFLTCDISDEQAVDQLFAKIVETIAVPTILVNSAFKSHIVEILELTTAQLQTELDINLKGPCYFSQRVAR
ncbi:MAG: SDR family NAD(P)-dependent oxidoreductase, partial [Sphingomonadaceae bacterium]